MKERPILSSSTEVRAILEGRKTQTRRIIRNNPYFDGPAGIEPHADGVLDSHGRLFKCPYGRVGDELWVRETFGYIGTQEPGGEGHIVYRADGEQGIRWRPSIHMPRWASRIQLRTTDIRVERLQDISDGDAIKEGCFFTDYGNKCYHPKPCPLPEKHAHHPIRNGWKCYETKSDAECLGNPRMGFANLWEEINTAQGKTWADNPLVWVGEFEWVK